MKGISSTHHIIQMQITPILISKFLHVAGKKEESKRNSSSGANFRGRLAWILSHYKLH
jgi:hypothetical protein